ncbi:MAG: hypothetical protein P8Y44_03625 [Acidobacteriota bacterium]
MRDSNRDPIILALKLLAKELQNRLQRHPGAHLLHHRDEDIELHLRIPIGRRRRWLSRERAALSQALTQGIRSSLIRNAITRPGHVYCLRCGTSDCDHSIPSRPTEVFAGYTPSGVPRFLDLGQWLLDRRDPRVDLLYRVPPALLAHRTDGGELSASLLPAFRDRDTGYHIHGQVTAGWYRFPTGNGSSEPLALTFQLISTRSSSGGRNLGLNLIGIGPESQPLENLYDLSGEIPWLQATRWAERTLSQIERAISRRGTPIDDELIERRIQGLLGGLGNRLEHERRSRARKTGHAQKRHRQKGRPTEKALADLESADPDQVLIDTRRDTFVVLGANGRAHIFNRSARLVTSIRYSAESIERRRRSGAWKPAIRSEIEELKSASQSTSR